MNGKHNSDAVPISEIAETAGVSRREAVRVTAKIQHYMDWPDAEKEPQMPARRAGSGVPVHIPVEELTDATR